MSKKSPDKLNIAFFGTSEFAVPILESLIATLSPKITVVTTPDKPMGRKHILTSSPVKVIAQKYNITVLEPASLKNFKWIEEANPDLIIIAAYGKILPKKIIDIPRYGSLNIHPSLLPKYRGPSPIQTTLLNQDKETGVSIILMDEKVDHGPILIQEKWPIRNDSTFEELLRELSELGAKLLIKMIPELLNKKLEPQAQKEADATYSKIIEKKDGKINWRNDALEIEAQIRALEPWPGTFTYFEINGERPKYLKILKAFVLKQTKVGPFGDPGKTFLAPDNRIAVQTGKDFLIIERLQPEGKKPMSAMEFIRGHKNFFGIILG